MSLKNIKPYFICQILIIFVTINILAQNSSPRWYIADDKVVYKHYWYESWNYETISDNDYYKDTINDIVYLVTYYNDIFYKKIGGSWIFFDSIPNYIEHKWQKNNCLYVSDKNFNKYKINLDTKELEPYKQQLDNIDKLQVKKIELAHCTIGCVSGHRTENRIVYKRGGKKFTIEKIINSDNDSTMLKRFPGAMDVLSIDSLFSTIVKSMKSGKIDTIQFNLNIDDKENYKKSIRNELRYFYKENQEYYNNFTTTIENIDKGTISEILSYDDNPYNSDMTGSSKTYVSFQLSNGETLIIQNVKFRMGYYGTPWIAIYKNEHFCIKSIKTGMLLDSATNGVFLPQNCKRKDLALIKIAKQFENKIQLIK